MIHSRGRGLNPYSIRAHRIWKTHEAWQQKTTGTWERRWLVRRMVVITEWLSETARVAGSKASLPSAA